MNHLRLETVRIRLARIAANLESLIQERKAVIARCPHDWRYEPDPSGNNDSYYECRVCGTTSRRLPKEAGDGH